MSPRFLATATAGNEAVAVAVSVVATVVVLALAAAVLWLLRTVRALRVEAEKLAGEAWAVIAELRATIDETSGDLARVDHLLEAAESVTATVESASRLAYSVFSRPVIKVLALSSGIAEVARTVARPGAGARRAARRPAGPGQPADPRRQAVPGRPAVRRLPAVGSHRHAEASAVVRPRGRLGRGDDALGPKETS